MALRVLDEIVSLAGPIAAVVKQVRPHDRELAEQLSRAWTRVATGAGEAQCRRGEKGRNRFDDAFGEAKEAHVALRVAMACRYVQPNDALMARVDGVAAVLYTLAHKSGWR